MEAETPDPISTLTPDIQSYCRAEPLQLPLSHPDGFAIEEFELFCKQCDRPTTEIRGIGSVHPHCIQISAAGICRACKVVTHGTIRWDGKEWTRKTNQGWISGRPAQTLGERVREFVGHPLRRQ